MDLLFNCNRNVERKRGERGKQNDMAIGDAVSKKQIDFYQSLKSGRHCLKFSNTFVVILVKKFGKTGNLSTFASTFLAFQKNHLRVFSI